MIITGIKLLSVTTIFIIFMYWGINEILKDVNIYIDKKIKGK